MHTTIAIANETTEQRIERFGMWYDNFVTFEGREPAVITMHRIFQRYGGPEEGGWYYTEGWPIQNICIFSKEQAIEKLLWLHSVCETEEYEADEYDINLSASYGKFYPERKPHYE